MLKRRGNLGTDRPRKKMMPGYKEKAAICRLRREALEEADPEDTLIWDLQPPRTVRT